MLPSSSVVEQVTVNHFVVGSIPTWAAIFKRQKTSKRIEPEAFFAFEQLFTAG